MCIDKIERDGGRVLMEKGNSKYACKRWEVSHAPNALSAGEERSSLFGYNFCIVLN